MTRKKSYLDACVLDCGPEPSGPLFPRLWKSITKHACVLECVRQAKRDAAFPGFPLSIVGRLQKPLETFRSLQKGKINNPFSGDGQEPAASKPWRRRVAALHSGNLRKAIVAYCRLRKPPGQGCFRFPLSAFRFFISVAYGRLRSLPVAYSRPPWGYPS
jgi:hypothetical protein